MNDIKAVASTECSTGPDGPCGPAGHGSGHGPKGNDVRAGILAMIEVIQSVVQALDGTETIRNAWNVFGLFSEYGFV